MKEGRRRRRDQGTQRTGIGVLDARPVARPQVVRKESPLARDVLHTTADDILAAVQLIKEGGEGSQEMRGLLGDFLRAREASYFAIAHTYNPYMEQAGDFLYSVIGRDGRKLYGSVVAMVDAVPEVTNHIPVADALRFPVDPAFDSSVMVVSGSIAQPRVQAYPSDIDLAEHIAITAEDRSEAIHRLVTGIQASVFDLKEVSNGSGQDVTIHFKCIRIGEYPEDVAAEFQDARTMKWTYDEIINGSKGIPLADGTVRKVTLEEVCADPKGFRFEYLGVVGEEVFEISKVANVDLTAPDGTHIENGETGVPAFKEIFLDDPSDTSVIPHVVDPDRFVNFVSQNLAQAEDMLSRQQNFNVVPACKRFYNLFKAIGDLSAAERLAEVFHSDSAKMKQLLGRYRPMQEAIAADLVPESVEETYFSELWEYILRYKEHWPTGLQRKFGKSGLNKKDVRSVAIAVSDKLTRIHLRDSGLQARMESLLGRRVTI